MEIFVIFSIHHTIVARHFYDFFEKKQQKKKIKIIDIGSMYRPISTIVGADEERKRNEPLIDFGLMSVHFE